MANPDFSKVWAKNSPLTPYEFTDSDYLEGWNFVGSTPPARGMFDALQKQTDEKLKALKDNEGNLIAWVSSTSYKVGDVRVYNKKIWQCKEANSDTTFDKTKWDNIGGGDSMAIGDIKWSSIDMTQEGCLVADGAAVSRAMYPELNAKYAADGYPWGAGDGSTTFNLPNLIGKFAEGATSAGGYHDAGLPNIEGKITYNVTDASGGTASGAFSNGAQTSQEFWSGGAYGVRNDLSFDANDSNTIYGNSDTVQPNSALLIPYVKAFDGATPDSALIDLTQVAQDLANKANRDLSNLTDNGKAFTFPSSTSVSMGTSAGEYTAPANGYATVQALGVLSESASLKCGNMGVSVNPNSSSGSNPAKGNCVLPVKKGEKYNLVVTNANVQSHYFIYAEGEV